MGAFSFSTLGLVFVSIPTTNPGTVQMLNTRLRWGLLWLCCCLVMCCSCGPPCGCTIAPGYWDATSGVVANVRHYFSRAVRR